MLRARFAIVPAAMAAACLGAGAGYAYSQLAGQAVTKTDCKCVEHRSDETPAHERTNRKDEMKGENPTRAESSWHRWPSLVDF